MIMNRNGNDHSGSSSSSAAADGTAQGQDSLNINSTSQSGSLSSSTATDRTAQQQDTRNTDRIVLPAKRQPLKHYKAKDIRDIGVSSPKMHNLFLNSKKAKKPSDGAIITALHRANKKSLERVEKWEKFVKEHGEYVPVF